MFRYRNEAAFSKALCSHLKKKGWFIQRIESGETGKGIPDIFAISATGVPIWLELKRVRWSFQLGSVLTIPWRPGQQAWLHNVTKRGVLCLTLACFDNGIVQIAHDKIHTENQVHTKDCTLYWGLQEI